MHALACCHLSVFQEVCVIAQHVTSVCFGFPQVQIAACDTFRSGAVEQLRTHCNRLSIPLYERGYEKDPAKVAYEAIKSAERSNIDVLLVDTAGEILGQLMQLPPVTFKLHVTICVNCSPMHMLQSMLLFGAILTAQIMCLQAGIGNCRAHARQ